MLKIHRNDIKRTKIRINDVKDKKYKSLNFLAYLDKGIVKTGTTLYFSYFFKNIQRLIH